VTARPFFIVSSGRSGTAMLHKALSAVAGVEMHHEYAVQITQPLAVKRYLGALTGEQTRAVLDESFGAAVRHTGGSHWGDSSNKLSWLVSDLAALFPQARFVHLVRDGRKVASSYFHKLGNETYDDRSNAALQAWYDGTGPAPPPEKPYWWPVPRRDDPLAKAFRSFDQFQRIAWHWAEVNRVAMEGLTALAPDRTLFTRLEDLSQSPAKIQELFNFLGIPYEESHAAVFARPHNVNKPEDKLLTDGQRIQFEAIAAPMMERLGYAGTPEYVVAY
jgi:putative sulfotransferase